MINYILAAISYYARVIFLKRELKKQAEIVVNRQLRVVMRERCLDDQLPFFISSAKDSVLYYESIIKILTRLRIDGIKKHAKSLSYQAEESKITRCKKWIVHLPKQKVRYENN